MTVTTTVTPVSTAMALAKVDEAKTMHYPSGVIGVRGAVTGAVPTDVQHDGQTVRIRAAESALAVREVLAEHVDGDWLVIVTDRDDDDLGAGILAHLVWQRLRNPDPWEAVRHRFAASGIDPALTNHPHSSDLAADLLAATPVHGWPAAPAGVLTRAHALGAVASAHLGYDGEAGDVLGILRWSMTQPSLNAVAELRHGVSHLLADATLAWIAERAGAAAAPIRALLDRGELADLVPLGVVVHLLVCADLQDEAARHQAQLALVRLEPRWGDAAPSLHALDALGRGTLTLLSDLVHDKRADADVHRTLHRADTILTQVQASGLARHSDLLASGLRARLVVLADALRRAVPAPGGGLGDPTTLRTVENAWAAVDAHRLGAADPAARRFKAAVRLVRWLTLGSPADVPQGSRGLAVLAQQHLSVDAWADVALHHVFSGLDDEELSPALQAVASAARAHRRQQERRFAAALATAGGAAPDGDTIVGADGTVWYLERLLTGGVIPLARRTPVLLLVMDGMSAAAATEIVHDATTRLGWTEAALPGSARSRAAALAVLPTLTEVSRSSLLTGRLVRGQQDEERNGYAQLMHSVGKIAARLFHKKGVDTTAAGWSVSHDVGAALDDPDISLVTVVLNSIDDALDRSDPAGTAWTADAVKHLEPLLARAAGVGRTVVMTADHGHIVERRLGSQRPHADSSSARSRAADGTLQEGEVEVAGPRVLTADHRAVLAVDDTLRYGPLKAGYHGGASAAEVVVPVVVLVRDEADALGLVELPPQQPKWWDEPSPAPGEPQPASIKRSQQASVGRVQDRGDTLFDVSPPVAPAATASASLGAAVVRSVVYKGQRKVAGRLMVGDDQVARLLDALAAAPATRLAPTPAAQALGVPQTRLRGALTQVQQLLNVEGYPVLAADAATGAVILDEALLSEQFGVLA